MESNLHMIIFITECLVCNVQPQQHPLYQKLHDFIFHDPAALKRKLCCKFCGFYFRGNQKLLTHIVNEHEGQEISQCDYCQKYFFQQNFLELHQNYGCSSNPNRSKFECLLCGIRFANSQKLRGHVIQTHIEIAKGIYFTLHSFNENRLGFQSLIARQCKLWRMEIRVEQKRNRRMKEISERFANYRIRGNHP